MLSSYGYQYIFIALLTGVAIVLGVAPLILATFVAPKKPGRVKQAPYECGIESQGDPWIQFRVQYYIYALLFVIFDVEAAFILPWAVAWKGLGLIGFVEMVLFIGILFAGLVYAWKRGLLEWR